MNVSNLPATPTRLANALYQAEQAKEPKLLSIAPRARILYADDDPCARRSGELVLSRSGYHVETAEDGEAAWEALHDSLYDLLITDNLMPRLNGIELVTKVRMTGMTLPIVMAASSIKTAPNHALAWLNVSATLQKPFSQQTLLNTIDQVLHSPAHGVLQPRIEPFPHWGINE